MNQNKKDQLNLGKTGSKRIWLFDCLCVTVVWNLEGTDGSVTTGRRPCHTSTVGGSSPHPLTVRTQTRRHHTRCPEVTRITMAPSSKKVLCPSLISLLLCCFHSGVWWDLLIFVLNYILVYLKVTRLWTKKQTVMELRICLQSITNSSRYLQN